MILKIYEFGLSQTLYYLFFALAFFTVYGFLIWFRKKIAIGLIKIILIEMIGSIFVLLVMFFLQRALSLLNWDIPIMNSYLNNMGRSFVFVPLIGIIVSRIVSVSWKKVCTVFSFSQSIVWGIASLGCLFPGCCTGYPCNWGIYNVRMETKVFPTQIINSIALLTVAVFIYKRCKNNHFEPDGKEYPVTLILIGAIRFLTEFIMWNEKIIFGLSSLSLDALGMCIVGAILYVLIDKKEKQIKA